MNNSESKQNHNKYYISLIVFLFLGVLSFLILKNNIFNGNLKNVEGNAVNTIGATNSTIDRVHVINIGISGQAILLESNGKYALIDAGGSNGDHNRLMTSPKIDSCDTHLYEYLRRMGVTELEFVLLSHIHYDHVACLAGFKMTDSGYLLDSDSRVNINIKKIIMKEYTNCDAKDYSTTFCTIVNKAEGRTACTNTDGNIVLNGNFNKIDFLRQDKALTLGDFKLDLFNSKEAFEDYCDADHKVNNEENSNSIVVILSKNNKMLTYIPSDLENNDGNENYVADDIARQVVAKYGSNFDVYFPAHHGYESGNSEVVIGDNENEGLIKFKNAVFPNNVNWLCNDRVLNKGTVEANASNISRITNTIKNYNVFKAYDMSETDIENYVTGVIGTYSLTASGQFSGNAQHIRNVYFNLKRTNGRANNTLYFANEKAVIIDYNFNEVHIYGGTKLNFGSNLPCTKNSEAFQGLVSISDSCLKLESDFVWDSFDVKNYERDEEKMTIDRIAPKTSITNYSKNFNLSNEYGISLNIDANNYISTGSETTILKNNTIVYKFTNIVRGDINGDGQLSPLDYVKVKNHIMGTNVITDDILTRAADANMDNNISPLDYVRIKNTIIGN